jgi:3'-phosphoadenosine 5'-phosphosulfate (PAPS) 3'-phosphatase
MPFHFTADADRQAMRDAAEEMQVYRELVERYTVYRKADRTPITPGQLEIMNGLRRIDPNRRK